MLPTYRSGAYSRISSVGLQGWEKGERERRRKQEVLAACFGICLNGYGMGLQDAVDVGV
jgi:hypothetical protein